MNTAVKAAMTVAVMLMLAAPAQAQYWGWRYPSYPSQVYTPRPAVHHQRRVHHAKSTAPSHRKSTGHHRSTAEWKASIQAQGREFCRANPRDPICPKSR